jgi:hypothetical protein
MRPAVLVSLLVLGSFQAAKLAVAQDAPAETGAVSANPPLSAEKQLEVRTSIARSSRALRAGEQLPRLDEKLAVGAEVPAEAELITLPQDAASAAPTTTSYRFVLMPGAIGVVDPTSRTVIQVIDEK